MNKLWQLPNIFMQADRKIQIRKKEEMWKNIRCASTAVSGASVLLALWAHSCPIAIGASIWGAVALFSHYQLRSFNQELMLPEPVYQDLWRYVGTQNVMELYQTSSLDENKVFRTQYFAKMLNKKMPSGRVKNFALHGGSLEWIIAHMLCHYQDWQNGKINETEFHALNCETAFRAFYTDKISKTIMPSEGSMRLMTYVFDKEDNQQTIEMWELWNRMRLSHLQISNNNGLNKATLYYAMIKENEDISRAIDLAFEKGNYPKNECVITDDDIEIFKTGVLAIAQYCENAHSAFLMNNHIYS